MDNLFQLIGRFHPLVVHLPIGILFLAIGIELYIKIKKKPNLQSLLPLLWGLGFATAVLACLLGLMLKLEGGYEEDALALHQNFGIALALITGIVFCSIKFKTIKKVKFPLVLISMFLLFATGHFGGNLTHGADYLTQPLQALLGKEQKREVRKPITNIEQAVVYSDLVAPILENKCQKCHSSSKKNGNLCMDSPEDLLKGGKHGEVFVAGNAAKSEMYTRLLLPEGDDKRMPPKGKTEITPEEIAIIKWWIEEGKADFKVKVAELTKPAIIKPLLAKLIGGKPNGSETESTTTENAEIPAITVPQPKQSDILSLEKQGVVFSPLTPDHNFLAVNLVNNPNFSDSQLIGLLKLKENILWLDLSGTKITDNALKSIGQLKNLTRLSLDNTAITNVGLKYLSTLSHLEHLNLYHTNISDIGLKSLQSLKALSTLHLWETKVTRNGVENLQQTLGKSVEINYESDF
jgi:uncharacterized membrane protein